jgi:hypothetical protein
MSPANELSNARESCHEMKPQDAPGEIGLSPIRTAPRSRPVAPCSTVGHGVCGGACLSLETSRRDLALSFRSLASRSGVARTRLHRILRSGWPARRSEMNAIRQVLEDELRLRRSSDPSFLRRIQQVAVPFLQRRLAASGQPAPDSPAVRLVESVNHDSNRLSHA